MEELKAKRERLMRLKALRERKGFGLRLKEKGAVSEDGNREGCLFDVALGDGAPGQRGVGGAPVVAAC